MDETLVGHTMPVSDYWSLVEGLTDKTRMGAYKGSLTHPPCIRNVIWLVAEEVMEVTAEQACINSLSRGFQANLTKLFFLVFR